MPKPSLNVRVLITRLEDIDANLGEIWGLLQNYEILDALEKERRHLNNIIDTLKKYEGQNTSIVGLEEPLITLKNPGLYSIPLGFLCVIGLFAVAALA